MNLDAIVLGALLSWAASTVPLASAGEQDRSRAIELGGIRKATAVISWNDTEYTVTAEIIPVAVFDGASNAAVNRRLLTGIALRGLAKFLSEEPAALTVTGATPGKVKVATDAHRLTIRMPVDGIKVQPTTETSGAAPCIASVGNSDPNRISIPGPRSLRAHADLFSRRQDYVTLIEELADVLEAEIDALPTILGEDAEAGEICRAKLEERVSRNFGALSAEIGNDLMLLSVEKDALLEAIRLRERRLLKAVHAVGAVLTTASQEEETDSHADDPAALPDRREQ